ncbi:MAG: hypothetical protein ACK5YR_02300 [Pirellula sp.]|jgi:hypothetical protein
MKTFNLPVEKDRLVDMNLNTALADLLSEDTFPSPSQLMTTANHPGITKIKWFTEQLDNEFRVIAIAERKSRIYAVLVSHAADEPGKLYLPLDIKNSGKENKWNMVDRASSDGISEEAKVLFDLFRNSFDTIDLERNWFLIAGTKAKDLVDFDRTGSTGSERWKESVVLFQSLGGDSLLLKNDNRVAWGQLETGRILDAGVLKEAIGRYFRCLKADVEFSSWTDPIYANQPINRSQNKR